MRSDEACPSIPARIAPREGNASRIFWSVMIPTYNPHPAHLEQALRSVLTQDPGLDRMQIEVVDDCSTDAHVAALVKRVGGERIAFHRNVKNLGLAGAWNNCLERSAGEWVHILHQDDYVLPGFYELHEETQRAHPEVSMIATRSFVLDDDGFIEGVTPRVRSLENGGREVQGLFYQNPIFCPGIVVRRSFYEKHGRFRTDLTFTLDWELWVRCTSACGGLISPHIKACYRNSADTATSRLMRSADSLRDEWRTNRIFKERYPDFDLERADQTLCRYAIMRAHSYAKCGDSVAASANLAFWNEHATWSIRLGELGSRLRIAFGAWRRRASAVR